MSRLIPPSIGDPPARIGLARRRPTVGLVALLLALAGCRGPAFEDAPPGRPAWVDGLVEGGEVRDLPDRNPEVADPYGDRASGAVPRRGVPKDLTQRLSSAPVSPRESASRREEPRAIAAGGARTRPSEQNVVVNVYSPEEDEDPASPAAAPELSQLEGLFRGQFRRSPARELLQFGYDYFASDGAPPEVAEGDVDAVVEALAEHLAGGETLLDGGPVPLDYVIGAGDEVVVTASGSFYAYHRLVVNRDGDAVLPDVGALSLAGRTFEELGDVFRSAYARTRKDFEVTVAMGRLRQIRVHVVGHVARPGLKELPARATPLIALIEAGGPDKTGSLRGINVHHADGSVSALDLYDLFVDGTQPTERMLKEGDVVAVPTVGPTVGIAGLVQRPAIYEFPEAVTIEEAVAVAGGFTPFTFRPNVQIERTIEGRGRETIDVALDEAGLATALMDGDLLLVGGIDDQLQPVVSIEGEVVRPGTYQFREGLTVTALVALADGLGVDADLSQALISRQVGAPGSIDMLGGEVTQRTPRRLIVVDLRRALAGDAVEDAVLQPLDLVTIRSRAEVSVLPKVSILGAVQQPGTYELTSGLRVSELIALAGNLLPEAYAREAELVRNVYDAELQRVEVRRFRLDLTRALAGATGDDPVLANGDRLVVRGLRATWVTVEVDGEVRFPGAYVFPSDARITDLIAAAGGLLPTADVRAAVFTRESVRRLQRERFEHLYETVRARYEGDLEQSVQRGSQQEGVAARLALVQTEELLGRMAQHQSNGRVVLPFVDADFPSSPSNLTLEDADRLHVPRVQETVSVVGHVFNPGAFVALGELTVASLVERCGGITEFGDGQRVYVIRADGNVRALHQESRRLTWDTPVYAGDVVLVPRAPLGRDWKAQLATYLSLLRSGAESALLLNNLEDSDLDVNWISRPDSSGGINYAETILD